MGLFDRIKDPIPGVARVITATGDPGSSEAKVTLSVQPDGMAATSLETTLRHPAGLAPESGELLPVVVDRKHPDRIEVDWDGVRRARATGRRRGSCRRGPASPRRPHRERRWSPASRR